MLVDVLPQTRDFRSGVLVILQEENVTAWIADHAADLLADGYVRVIVTPHVPTRTVGDRRRRRR